MMRTFIFIALAIAAGATSAVAAPPPAAPVHNVQLTDQDLAAIAAAQQRIGHSCNPQDEVACMAQVQLDALVNRLRQQLAPPATPKPHR